MKRAALILACLTHAAGADRAHVAREIRERTGLELGPGAKAGAVSLPPGVVLGERLAEDAAVAIALWNNAALEADLSQIGLARADLIEAGVLRNPNLSLLLPVGPKPFEFALTAPIEALWHRPRRMRAARIGMDRVAAGLVQNGLDLVRDVRVAFADLALAEQQAAVAGDAAAMRTEIAALTEKRLRAGDVSELELNLARMDGLVFVDRAARARRGIDIASERLRLLMGLRGDARALRTAAVPPIPTTPADWPALVEKAMAARPDLRAAELAVDAARARAGWERSRILALLAPMLSIKEVGDDGVRSGPGVTMDLPIVDRNRGPIKRAEAELERATRQYLALRDVVEHEVRRDRLDLADALESLGRVRDTLLPAARENISLAQKRFAAGDASYLSTLEASRALHDVRAWEVEADAAVRRASARLERSVGRR